MRLPLFQEIKSNWMVIIKTYFIGCMVHSLINPSSIKEVKVLKLITGVGFVFGSCSFWLNELSIEVKLIQKKIVLLLVLVYRSSWVDFEMYRDVRFAQIQPRPFEVD